MPAKKRLPRVSDAAELNNCANLLAYQQGYRYHVIILVDNRYEGVTQLCRYPVFYTQTVYNKIFRQQFHGHTDVIGIVHMTVVIYVGPHHGYRGTHLPTLLRQFDPTVAIRHIKLRFQVHGSYCGIVNTFHFK